MYVLGHVHVDEFFKSTILTLSGWERRKFKVHVRMCHIGNKTIFNFYIPFFKQTTTEAD